MRKRTKIITTLGPASSSPKIIQNLIEAGTDVFRINLSHSSIEEIGKIINTLKRASALLKRPVATLIDLQGQKIRIKGFANKKFIKLIPNSEFILDAALDENKGSEKSVGITYKDLSKNVEVGDKLLLSDAAIKLEVTKIFKGKIYTNIVRGGKLKPFQGLNKKGGGLSLKGITPKDIKNLKSALSLDIDYVAVSFVRDDKDIKDIKKIIGKKPVGVIAKIERNEALKNIDEIAKASDGLLVARGDLGVEIGIEQLPAVQDMLIRKAISHDKIVIVATQMMESMINNRVPTRAEVFDVANAVTQNQNVVAFADGLPSSSYAVIDSGYKYMYDKYNDVYRYVPLNGDTAGLCARTDSVADAWFSPGGFNRGQIRGAVKLAFNPNQTQRDELYKSRVNPCVSFPGQGTVLFGDKTAQSKPSAFDRINVRRLFIVLEKAVSTAAKFQLFEFNDEFSRANFRNLVEPFLRDVQGRQGLTDFSVVCDDTNNTSDVIDRNEFRADIFIKPNFVATRSGVAFTEVAGA